VLTRAGLPAGGPGIMLGKVIGSPYLLLAFRGLKGPMGKSDPDPTQSSYIPVRVAIR